MAKVFSMLSPGDHCPTDLGERDDCDNSRRPMVSLNVGTCVLIQAGSVFKTPTYIFTITDSNNQFQYLELDIGFHESMELMDLIKREGILME